ncbi:hypothetical protein [Nannocystis pusilla]|uniref:hypothetical protein n=1 Tax=Nannocystis pusilla TaxID=889268 RepID=UPI003DA2CE63
MVAQTEGLSRRGTLITSTIMKRIEAGGAGDVRLFAGLGLGDRQEYEGRVRAIVSENWSLIDALSLELQTMETLFHEEPALILGIEFAKDPSLKRLLTDFLARYRELRQESQAGAASATFRSRYPEAIFPESVGELIIRQPESFRDLREKLSKFDLQQLPFLDNAILWNGTPGQLRNRILRDSAIDKLKTACKAKVKSWLPW